MPSNMIHPSAVDSHMRSLSLSTTSGSSSSEPSSSELAFLSALLEKDDLATAQTLLGLNSRLRSTLEYSVAALLRFALPTLLPGETSRACVHPNPNLPDLRTGVLAQSSLFQKTVIDFLVARLRAVAEYEAQIVKVLEAVPSSSGAPTMVDNRGDTRVLSASGWDIVSAVTTVVLVRQALGDDIQGPHGAVRFARTLRSGPTISLVLDFPQPSSSDDSPASPHLSVPTLRRILSAPTLLPPSLPRDHPTRLFNCVLSDVCAATHDQPVMRRPSPTHVAPPITSGMQIATTTPPAPLRATTAAHLECIADPAAELFAARVRTVSADVADVFDWIARGAPEESTSVEAVAVAEDATEDARAEISGDEGKNASTVVPFGEMPGDELLDFGDDREGSGSDAGKDAGNRHREASVQSVVVRNVGDEKSEKEGAARQSAGL